MPARTRAGRRHQKKIALVCYLCSQCSVSEHAASVPTSFRVSRGSWGCRAFPDNWFLYITYTRHAALFLRSCFAVLVADAALAWCRKKATRGLDQTVKRCAWCLLSCCFLPQTIYGKSRVLQVLLTMAADPRLAEDMLVDLLMDVLADETPCPLSEKESCELEAPSRFCCAG